MSMIRCGAVIVLVVAVLAVPLSTYFLVEIPDGMANPHWARTLLTVTKLSGIIGDTLEPLFGPDYHVDVIRSFVRFSYMYLPRPALPSDVQVQNATFGGVPVLVYIPEDLSQNGPGVVYIHGGGWVFGTVVNDRISIWLAKRLKAVVIAVEYRLAPQYIFPAALDDCEAATVHFMDHALEYGVDPEKIIVAGDSAGGNLAAAVSLSLRNKEFYPLPAAQILIYPLLQAMDFQTPSYLKYPKHAIVRRQMIASCWLWYALGHARDKHMLLDNQHVPDDIQISMKETTMRLGKLPPDFLSHVSMPTSITKPTYFNSKQKWTEIQSTFTNPLFSPMMARNLSGLPTSLVITVEQDVLRDEGAWYAHHLQEAGVTTIYKHYNNGFHGILSFDTQEESRQIMGDMVRFIKQYV